ncbi:F-box protein [Citrus sinensis]|uniref:F-box protein n=1 Tax=Citrus sinensis TaxID=2711 RepID=A0ACB8HWF8_CITSI|nr:F-box protein [Citrus sinensis]
MSSSEAVASNDGLLTEILVHLPIKSLMKFKCISKHWQSLISSPGFSRRLYPDSHLVSGLILRPTYDCVVKKEYDFVPLKYTSTTAPFRSLTFVNHPSGLIILQSFPPLGDENSRFIRRIGLAYDPAKSSHFKIVCIRSDSLEVIQNAGISYQIEVYSSQTGSWRLSGVPFILPYNSQYGAGVFWNAAIHWISHCHACLCFKVDEEQLQEMPMPPLTRDPADRIEGFMRSFVYFGESREHLHFVVNVDNHSKKFDVYEMQRDYSGYFVKYRVDLDVIIAAFPEMDVPSDEDDFLFFYAFDCYKYSILGIIREANDEESYMVLHIPGKVIRYKLNDKTFTKICDFHPGHEDVEGSQLEFTRLHAYHYMETLARFG